MVRSSVLRVIASTEGNETPPARPRGSAGGCGQVTSRSPARRAGASAGDPDGATEAAAEAAADAAALLGRRGRVGHLLVVLADLLVDRRRLQLLRVDEGHPAVRQHREVLA